MAVFNSFLPKLNKLTVLWLVCAIFGFSLSTISSATASSQTPATTTTASTDPTAINPIATDRFLNQKSIQQREKNGLAVILCKGLRLAQSRAGKAFVVFLIILAGVGAFFGKLSWALIISLGIGMSLMFGATKIVSLITVGTKGEGGCDCKTSVQVSPYKRLGSSSASTASALRGRSFVNTSLSNDNCNDLNS